MPRLFLALPPLCGFLVSVAYLPQKTAISRNPETLDVELNLPANSLAGKRVLVTAGGDGIGLEITRAFTEAGAKVLVCDIRPESLERLAKNSA